VFTTAYTGYEESLTDPSYAEQILTFSYPLIGNYGVRSERFESESVQPRAAIARELTDDVAEWLADEDVPAVDHVDTREIVTTVREEGAMACGIAAGPDATPRTRSKRDGGVRADERPRRHRCAGVGDDDRLRGRRRRRRGPARLRREGLDHLLAYRARRGRSRPPVRLDPRTWPTDVDPDVLFVSNGPGDPENFIAAQAVVDAFAGDLPMAGICLGQQVITSALGGSTEKMAFGHRGVNQPVRTSAPRRS